MHIIKISPVSFKIVLSKEDLQRYGVENVLEHTSLSGDFFADIIEKTNAMYGNPFPEGSIDAEFFESKDGGGELFISGSKSAVKSITYLFRTNDIENLIALCSRINGKIQPCESSLYHENGRYNLLMVYPKRDEMLLACLKEYGNASEISRLQKWLLEEHSRLLIARLAIEAISESF